MNKVSVIDMEKLCLMCGKFIHDKNINDSIRESVWGSTYSRKDDGE